MMTGQSSGFPKTGGRPVKDAPKNNSLLQHPAAPFVAPFAVFMLLLAIGPKLGLPDHVDLVLRILLPAATIWYFSRHLLSLKFVAPFASIILGIGVFVLWIAPDILWPAYRSHWLFQNSITGQLTTSLSQTARVDTLALVLRSFRAILIVSVLEELFWRGWVMRWLIQPKFQLVAPGTYETRAFWIVALLFAAEHGPFWDVGLLAGAIYNCWMVRTKSWMDCILAHAVTNACLCLYVVLSGRWEYWL